MQQRASWLVAVALVACGHSHVPDQGGGDDVDASASDGAGTDAHDSGGGDGSDAGGGGDGSGSGIDPAACAVGVADGCCPTGIAYGGSDPDCIDLGGCPISVSDPIAIDDDWQPYGISGVGMAWTGRELVLAWAGVGGTWPNQVATIEYQRRDHDGALTFGPVSHVDAAATVGVTHPTPELGFEPTTHTILYASSKQYQRYVETLDALGAPASAATNIGVDCNPIMARYQIYPWQGRFLVAQDNAPCSGSEWHGARIDTIGTNGVRSAYSLGDQSSYMIGMTFDAANGRVVFSGGNQTLNERVFTAPSTWSAPALLQNVYTYDTGIAAGGGGFLVVYGSYYLTSSHQITSDPWWGRWTIGTNGSVAQTQAPATLTVGANRQTVAPRLVWTGSGWIELSSSFLWEGQGLPNNWTSFATNGWSFGANGSLGGAFQLDPAHPTYLVNAIWAGDRVAVTYVTTDDGQSHERRYLRYLRCAQ
jgi:hypothetical protein